MSKFMKSLCKIAIPVTLQSMLQASFSIVDQIMIGQLGETNISAVGLCGNFSLIFSVVIGAVAVSALLILLAGVYTGLYRVDDSVKELGKTLLIVFALYAPVKVENMILGGGIIRSGGNTKIIMIIDIVGTWCIGIPLCLLAAYVFKWGIVGVYTLLTTEELFRLAVSLIVFNNRSKNSLTSIGTPLKKSLFCIKQYNIKCFYLF